MVADALAVPAVPVTVAVYVPAATARELVEEKVRVLGFPALAVGFLKLAVTPLGRPEIARLTLLSLKPTGFATLMLVLRGVPARRLNVFAEVKRLKPGLGMVSVTEVVLVSEPEVPLIVIG
jgi:hypothetical protein